MKTYAVRLQRLLHHAGTESRAPLRPEVRASSSKPGGSAFRLTKRPWAPASVLAFAALATGCGAAQAHATSNHAARACTGDDVTARSSGIVGLNDGSNPAGSGRRVSTVAGITLVKHAGSPCVLTGIAVAVTSRDQALNVTYQYFPDSSPVGTLHAKGDIATTSVAWFAPWCGQRRALTFALKWHDGHVTPANTDAVAPPCTAAKGRGFVTSTNWVVNPGSAGPR